MKSTSVPSVSVYDPNHLNPYGLELASTLAAGGAKIQLWRVRNSKAMKLAGITELNHLAPPRGSARASSILIRRLFAPLWFVLTVPSKDVVVIAWTRDAWDGFLLLVRAVLLRRTVVVYHNPRQVRARGGLSGKMEWLLLRMGNPAVHSEWLAGLAREDFNRVMVAIHPPYFETTRRVAAWTPPPRGDSPIVAFVGALRMDKGVGDLVAIASASGGGWTLRLCTDQRLSPETVELLAALDVRVQNISDKAPTDAELNAGLLGSDLVIAPYRSVTESGSILLALSIGVPILAYSSPAVASVLVRSAQAAGPSELGGLIGQFLSSPWQTNADATDRRSLSIEDWKKVVSNATAR